MGIRLIILIFVAIVAAVGLIGFTVLYIATYPSLKSIKKMYKELPLSNENYFFYLQKATAYRNLFTCHLVFNYFVKVLGAVATIITVYFAFEETYNDFIILSALIATTCNLIGIVIPFEKLAGVFVRCARIMEKGLYENYEGQDIPQIKQSLNNKYQECEDLIAKDFM